MKSLTKSNCSALLIGLIASLLFSGKSYGGDIAETEKSVEAKTDAAKLEKFNDDLKKADTFCSKTPGFQRGCSTYENCADLATCGTRNIDLSGIEKFNSDDADDEFTSDETDPRKKQADEKKFDKEKIEKRAEEICEADATDSQSCGSLTKDKKRKKVQDLAQKAKKEKGEKLEDRDKVQKDLEKAMFELQDAKSSSIKNQTKLFSEIKKTQTDLLNSVEALDSETKRKKADLDKKLQDEKTFIDNIYGYDKSNVLTEYDKAVKDVNQTCYDDAEQQVKIQRELEKKLKEQGRNKLGSAGDVLTTAAKGGAEGVDNGNYQILSNKCLQKTKTRDKLFYLSRKKDNELTALENKLKLAISNAARTSTEINLLLAQSQKELTKTQRMGKDRLDQLNAEIRADQTSTAEKEKLQNAQISRLKAKLDREESEVTSLTKQELVSKAALSCLGGPISTSEKDETTSKDDEAFNSVNAVLNAIKSPISEASGTSKAAKDYDAKIKELANVEKQKKEKPIDTCTQKTSQGDKPKNGRAK